MAFETHTYDPAQIILNFGGRDISGFAKGTFVKIMRNEDAFKLTVGADGENTRSKSNNKSGRFIFTLIQGSLSNDYLSSLATADELSNGGVVAGLVKDALGTTIAQAAKCWSVKKPDSEFADEAGNREWIFETGNMDYTVGGNAVI